MIYYTFPETIGIYLIVSGKVVLLGNARYIRPQHTAKPDYNAVRVKEAIHGAFFVAATSDFYSRKVKFMSIMRVI